MGWALARKGKATSNITYNPDDPPSALLSVETHRRAATGNTKSREVAGALAGTAPSTTARNSITRPEIPKNVGRAT